MRPARQGQGGFTLIELLISITILSFMMVIAWSVLSGTVFARKNLVERQERDDELRMGLTQMVRDLASAYISANEDQNLIVHRTMLVGKNEGDIQTLQFSSMDHQVLWADADESEQTVITYEAEADPDDRSITNLIRREQRRPSNEPHTSEPADVDVVIHDVSKVTFEYYDWRAQDWKDEWDSTQADAQRGRLPTRVRITVEARWGDGKIKRTTEARIMLQEQLQFFAN